MKRYPIAMAKAGGARRTGTAVLILAAASLVGCGGGGGGSGSGSGSSAGAVAKSVLSCTPEDFTVAAGADPRELAFDWTICDEDAVDHYRVEVNADGASGYTVLAGAGSVAASEYTHTVPVHLTDWVNALYRVVAVDGSGKEFASNDLGLLNTVAAEDVIGYFKASNTDGGDRFGYRGSLDGDTLAVGAFQENSAATSIDGDGADNSASAAGAVYVFRRDGANRWSQQAYIKGSNTEEGDRFGGSVSLDGDTLAVGASGEDGDGTTLAGAVYVFTRDAGGAWSEEAHVKADNPVSDDRFGWSVSLSGDTLAVGAHQDDGVASNEGAVYVFTRNGNGDWPQQAYIKASHAGQDDQFGYSVSLDGDTLAVGAIGEDSAAEGIDHDADPVGDDDNARDAGAVYVFTHDGNGDWPRQAYIKAGNTGQDDRFGYSVSLDGDTLAVGATEEDGAATGIDHDAATAGDDDGAPDAGAVYVFARDGDAVWSQQAYVKAANAAGGDEFGASVSLSGDTLAVGAIKEGSAATGIDGDGEDNSATGSGAVYVFTRDGDTAWSQRAYVKASNTGAEDQFGANVAVSGDALAVGAHQEDGADTGIDGDAANNEAPDAGAVYLY